MKFLGLSHQLKRIPILVSALALMLSVTPTVVQSQTTLEVIQATALANVKLSAQQKAHVTQLIEATREQISSILTPVQQHQFQAALLGDTTFDAAFAAMKLSQKQQTQLQKVLWSSQEQAEAVLTPKQLKQVHQNVEDYFESHKI